MSKWLEVALAVGAIYYLALVAYYFIWEAYTAPLVDSDFRVIEDPHHRTASSVF